MYGLWMIGCLQIAAVRGRAVAGDGDLVCGRGAGGRTIVWVTLMQRGCKLLGRVKSVDWLLSLDSLRSRSRLPPARGWLGEAGAADRRHRRERSDGGLLLPARMRDTETPGNTSRVILSDPAETMVAPAEEPDGALAGARPGQ
jgi:hypothetical protein